MTVGAPDDDDDFLGEPLTDEQADGFFSDMKKLTCDRCGCETEAPPAGVGTILGSLALIARLTGGSVLCEKCDPDEG